MRKNKKRDYFSEFLAVLLFFVGFGLLGMQKVEAHVVDVQTNGQITCPGSYKNVPECINQLNSFPNQIDVGVGSPNHKQTYDEGDDLNISTSGEYSIKKYTSYNGKTNELTGVVMSVGIIYDISDYWTGQKCTCRGDDKEYHNTGKTYDKIDKWGGEIAVIGNNHKGVLTDFTGKKYSFNSNITIPISSDKGITNDPDKIDAVVFYPSYVLNHSESRQADGNYVGTANLGAYAELVYIKPTKTDGQCGFIENGCVAGTLQDIADSSTQYLWNCLGTNGGITANCSKDKPGPQCGDSADKEYDDSSEPESTTLCTKGTPSPFNPEPSMSPSISGLWQWTCSMTDFPSATCSAYKKGKTASVPGTGQFSNYQDACKFGTVNSIYLTDDEKYVKWNCGTKKNVDEDGTYYKGDPTKKLTDQDKDTDNIVNNDEYIISDEGSCEVTKTYECTKQKPDCNGHCGETLTGSANPVRVLSSCFNSTIPTPITSAEYSKKVGEDCSGESTTCPPCGAGEERGSGTINETN